MVQMKNIRIFASEDKSIKKQLKTDIHDCYCRSSQ